MKTSVRIIFGKFFIFKFIIVQKELFYSYFSAYLFGRMKFFFNPDGEEALYSEVFINIDLSEKRLEFNEKDNDYRAPLLRSLLQ